METTKLKITSANFILPPATSDMTDIMLSNP